MVEMVSAIRAAEKTQRLDYTIKEAGDKYELQ